MTLTILHIFTGTTCVLSICVVADYARGLSNWRALVVTLSAFVVGIVASLAAQVYL